MPLLQSSLLHSSESLGAEEYGLWILALSLTFTSGYLALADLGFAEAAVKLIAEARAAGSERRISEVASTTIAIFAVLGIIIGGAVALLAPALVSLFGVPNSLVGTARFLFAVMALEVTIELPSAALRSVLEGVQRYSWLRSIDVAGRVLWGLAAVVLVQRGYGVVSLAVAMTLVTVLRASLTLIATHRAVNGLELRPRCVKRSVFRGTAAYGSFVGGLRFLSVVYSQMDRLIVAIVYLGGRRGELRSDLSDSVNRNASARNGLIGGASGSRIQCGE